MRLFNVQVNKLLGHYVEFIKLSKYKLFLDVG